MPPSFSRRDPPPVFSKGPVYSKGDLHAPPFSKGDEHAPKNYTAALHA